MSMTGLDKITDRILADARLEADRILSDAEAESTRIRADYARRADQIRETLSGEAERDAMDMIARAKSSAATQKRNYLLQKKSDLVDSAFADTLESVKRLDDQKYTNLMIGLLTACFLKQIESEQTSRELYGEEDAIDPDAYEVIMNLRDRDRCGEAVVNGVSQKLCGKVPSEKLSRLTLSKASLPIDGGFILRCGSIETNCTLSLLFAQLREELEAEVGQALFAPKKQK